MTVRGSSSSSEHKKRNTTPTKIKDLTKVYKTLFKIVLILLMSFLIVFLISLPNLSTLIGNGSYIMLIQCIGLASCIINIIALFTFLLSKILNERENLLDLNKVFQRGNAQTNENLIILNYRLNLGGVISLSIVLGIFSLVIITLPLILEFITLLILFTVQVGIIISSILILSGYYISQIMKVRIINNTLNRNDYRFKEKSREINRKISFNCLYLISIGFIVGIGNLSLFSYLETISQMNTISIISTFLQVFCISIGITAIVVLYYAKLVFSNFIFQENINKMKQSYLDALTKTRRKFLYVVSLGLLLIALSNFFYFLYTYNIIYNYTLYIGLISPNMTLIYFIFGVIFVIYGLIGLIFLKKQLNQEYTFGKINFMETKSKKLQRFSFILMGIAIPIIFLQVINVPIPITVNLLSYRTHLFLSNIIGAAGVISFLFTKISIPKRPQEFFDIETIRLARDLNEKRIRLIFVSTFTALLFLFYSILYYLLWIDFRYVSKAPGHLFLSFLEIFELIAITTLLIDVVFFLAMNLLKRQIVQNFNVLEIKTEQVQKYDIKRLSFVLIIVGMALILINFLIFNEAAKYITGPKDYLALSMSGLFVGCISAFLNILGIITNFFVKTLIPKRLLLIETPEEIFEPEFEAQTQISIMDENKALLDQMMVDLSKRIYSEDEDQSLKDAIEELSIQIKPQIENMKKLEDRSDLFWHKCSDDIGNCESIPGLKSIVGYIKTNYNKIRDLLEFTGNETFNMFNQCQEKFHNPLKFFDMAQEVIDSIYLVQSEVGTKLDMLRNNLIGLFYERKALIDKIQRDDASQTQFQKKLQNLYLKIKEESEKSWWEKIQRLYLFTVDKGIVIHDQTFKSLVANEPNFVSGGFLGLSALIQEITQKKSQVKIIEQEGISIILESGKYLTGALIAEENLRTLRNKLIEFIREIETFYEEELEEKEINTSLFTKVEKFTHKIFTRP